MYKIRNFLKVWYFSICVGYDAAIHSVQICVVIANIFPNPYFFIS